MVKQIFNFLQNSGKLTFIGWNSSSSIEMYAEQLLEKLEKTYIMNTNGNSEADLLHIAELRIYITQEKLKPERHQKIIQNLN